MDIESDTYLILLGIHHFFASVQLITSYYTLNIYSNSFN